MDRFFSPTSTWNVQNLLDSGDARMPLDFPPPLIDSTTVHYNSTGIHSNSHWLVFLTSVQQWRSLLSGQQHKYVLPCIAEMYRNPPKYSYPLYCSSPHLQVHSLDKDFSFNAIILGLNDV